MDYWQQLLQTALLGTQRKPLDIAHFPDDLQACLPISGEPAAQLLHAITGAHLWRQAGWVSAERDFPTLSPAPDEAFDYAPVASWALFNRLFAPGTDLPGLQLRWLQRCQAANWIAPPAHVAAILNTGAGGKQKQAMQEAISAVVGARGRWLAQFNPAWNYVQNRDAAEIWENGTPDPRREVFRQWRLNDPAAALARLKAAWPNEPARDRKRLIELLDIGLQPADQPFLEQVVEECGTNAKTVVTDLRTAALQRLLMLPDSPQSKLLWATVQAHISIVQRSKALGFSHYETLEVVFKNTKLVADTCRDLGIDTTNQSPDQYENEQFMLRRLIGWVPPERWLDCWPNHTATEILTVFATETTFIKKSSGAKKPFALYVSGLIEATARFQRQDWATVIAQQLGAATPANIVPLLSTANQDIYFAKNGFDDAEKMNQLLQRGNWSLALSRIYLQHVRQHIVNAGYYYFPYKRESIALCLHPDTRTDLNQMADMDSSLPADRWLRSFAVDVLDLMALVRLIEA